MNLDGIIAESRRRFNLGIIEKYNRRCRRITALFMAGRKLTDHIIIQRTDMMRIGYEMALKSLTTN